MKTKKPLIQKCQNPLSLVSMLTGMKALGGGNVSQHAVQIAPIATLASIVFENRISLKKGRVAVLGQHLTNRSWDKEYYSLLSLLLGRDAPLCVDVFFSSLGVPYEHSIKNSVCVLDTVEEKELGEMSVADYDIIFWPTPSMSADKDLREKDYVIKAIGQNVPVYSCHFSRFDSLVESLMIAAKEDCAFSYIGSNKFSVRVEHETWGDVVCRLTKETHSITMFKDEPMEVFALIVKQLTESAGVLDVFSDFGRVVVGNRSSQGKYECLSKTAAIDIENNAILKRSEKGKTERLYSISRSLKNLFINTDTWSLERLRLALFILGLCGVPGCKSLEEQKEIEEKLYKYAQNGSALSSLVLGKYRLVNDTAEASAAYRLNAGDAYCAYFLGISPTETLDDRLRFLSSSMSMGLGSAASQALSLIQKEKVPESKLIIVGMRLDTILSIGVDTRDPAILTFLAENEFRLGRVENGVKYLAWALSQTYVPAVNILRTLPKDVWSTHKKILSKYKALL